MGIEAAAFLRQHIGKEVSDSPSAFMSWLKPVMAAVDHDSLTFEYTVRKEMTNPFRSQAG